MWCVSFAMILEDLPAFKHFFFVMDLIGHVMDLIGHGASPNIHTRALSNKKLSSNQEVVIIYPNALLSKSSF